MMEEHFSSLSLITGPAFQISFGIKVNDVFGNPSFDDRISGVAKADVSNMTFLMALLWEINVFNLSDGIQ